MLIYTLLIIVLPQTHSLKTDLTHNITRVVRHKTDYQVNISMIDEDIQMVDKDLISLRNTTSKLSKTHKKFYRTIQNRSDDDKYNTVNNSKVTKNRSLFDTISPKFYQSNSSIRNNYSNANTQDKSNKTQDFVIIDLPRITREISADRMWTIVQIWLIIYIVLAIPLWCTLGRCCCCLMCKCFKAQETIREAKLYAIWNPPGVLRKSAGDVTYTPSDKEKEAYEELEHLLRTL